MLSITSTPAFQAETASGQHNARYVIGRNNSHDFPITLDLASLRVPASFVLLGNAAHSNDSFVPNDHRHLRATRAQLRERA